MNKNKKMTIIIVVGVIVSIALSIYTVFKIVDIYNYKNYDYYKNISYNENDYPICKDINELDEDTKKLCEEFLNLCEKENLPVMIIETYRTQERQDYLYSQGRTREGNQVTWTKKSYHSSRRAFDIAKDEKGNEFGDDEFFRRCAEIGESIGLESGYYWKNYKDSGHFQN